MNKSSTLILTLQRYNPERDSAPHDELFPVPWDEQTSLLDALGYIKDNLAHDLARRWSCRMAICGSCGVMVNGIPKLACKTFLRDYPDGLRIAPLANFPVERDLVVDMSRFIESPEAIKPYIIGNRACVRRRARIRKPRRRWRAITSSLAALTAASAMPPARSLA